MQTILIPIIKTIAKYINFKALILIIEHQSHCSLALHHQEVILTISRKSNSPKLLKITIFILILTEVLTTIKMETL